MSIYFNNIISNDKLKSMLSSYITEKSMPHAFIIEGPVGSGKKLVAKTITAALSCMDDGSDSIPCMKCLNCMKIFKGVSPDVITIDSDGKASIGVDTVRELKNHTYISSNELDMKAYIIDGADKMTVAAQNAFLKILEEPVTDVLYFLCCENSQLMLPTVISRAPIIRTTPVSRVELSKFIADNYNNVSKEKADLICAISHGNIGQAVNYINDESSFEQATESRECVYEFLRVLFDSDSRYELIAKFSTKNEKSSYYVNFLRLLYSALRDVILYKEAGIDIFDFFIDIEDINNNSKKIKAKTSKKLCLIIEETIEKLIQNQGVSSTNSIMLTFSMKAWSAKF